MTEIDMGVEIAGVRFKNPVMTCSGTFGSGREYSDFFDLSELGAVVCKGVSAVPWEGNPPPRIAEVFGGMLNSVGLENPGVEWFISSNIPFLQQFETHIIANLAGHSIGEYCAVAERLNDTAVTMYELNISCPNISEGGASFGVSPDLTEEVTERVKRVSRKPLIVKLSPNVSDITEVAAAAERGGADALSLINTVKAMKIDIRKKKPVLSRNIGGLSGPAVKAIAVRMVYEASRAVSLPIIGMGGIRCAEDAVEFILAGACAVGVGSAHFSNPLASVEVVRGIRRYMEEEGFGSVREIQDSFSLN